MSTYVCTLERGRSVSSRTFGILSLREGRLISSSSSSARLPSCPTFQCHCPSCGTTLRARYVGGPVQRERYFWRVKGPDGGREMGDGAKVQLGGKLGSRASLYLGQRLFFLVSKKENPGNGRFVGKKKGWGVGGRREERGDVGGGGCGATEDRGEGSCIKGSGMKPA